MGNLLNENIKFFSIGYWKYCKFILGMLMFKQLAKFYNWAKINEIWSLGIEKGSQTLKNIDFRDFLLN